MVVYAKELTKMFKGERRRQFKVTWGIHVDALSFEDAARQALVIQRDPESIATVFEVFADDQSSQVIDLLQIDRADSTKV
jgi:hypothetical protein